MSLWSFGAGDGTHALVAGVGDYPALVGGSGTLFPQHGGMAQLTSASPSAIAFADWLTREYQSASAPLRSLELLISDSAPVQYTAGGNMQTVERATIGNLRQRVLDWYGRANASDQNRAIFYFCGHGIASGIQCTLLLEDFGTVAGAALSSALDYTRFHLAMDQCRAREQLFLVDACRVSSPTLWFAGGYCGDPVLTPGRPTTPPRKPPMFFSALPGTTAYGQANQPSFFTEALIRALHGSGAGKKGNGWSIVPSILYRGLTRLLDRTVAGTGVTQGCTVDQLVDFSIHDLAGAPEVPVTVDCMPPIDLTADRLRATSTGANREQQPPVPKPWCVDLPYGQYRFSASSPGGSIVYLDDIVFPPYTDVVLP
jgi:hypothetical protein